MTHAPRPLRRLSIHAAALAAVLPGGCAGLPFDVPKPASHAPEVAIPGRLATAAAPWLDGSGVSGFVLLPSGTDALGARLRLAEAADHTIDAQYFLVKPDFAGALFGDALLAAADRGVRVRLLVDDVFTTTSDVQLGTLDRHPRIEVRIFNPISRSGPYWVAFARDFTRANRRMHNKSFTADNAVTIVGGRNIADEYFAIADEINFADLDLLGAGHVASQVSGTFDLFWNSRLAVPLATLAPGAVARAEAAGALVARLSPETLAAARSIYAEAVAAPLVTGVAAGEVRPVPGRSTVVSDPPAKLAAPAGAGHTALANALDAALAAAEREVILVTPYFVPGRPLADRLKALRARGVEVIVITNSLASTNHAYVHGGYLNYRRELMEAGVRFHEAKADSATSLLTGGPGHLTLHAKVVVIDRRDVLAGSMNLDPRSLHLNTELGAFVRSPELARDFIVAIAAELPQYSFVLDLEPDGRVAWYHGNAVWYSEPGASLARRLFARLVQVLPVEGLL